MLFFVIKDSLEDEATCCGLICLRISSSKISKNYTPVMKLMSAHFLEIL